MSDLEVFGVEAGDVVLGEAEQKLVNAQLRKIDAEIALYDAQRANFEAEAESSRLQSGRDTYVMDGYNFFGEQRGIFNFYMPVIEETIGPFMKRLDAWSYRNEGKPITIIFNSPGGAVFDGMALYDFLLELRRRGHRLTTKCLGAALSMGAVLLQAGDERVMSANAFFLIHEVSLYGEGLMNTSATEDRLDLQRKIQKIVVKQLAARATISQSEIEKRWKKFEWLMEANEALQLGFIDRVEA